MVSHRRLSDRKRSQSDLPSTQTGCSSPGACGPIANIVKTFAKCQVCPLRVLNTPENTTRGTKIREPDPTINDNTLTVAYFHAIKRSDRGLKQDAI